MDLFARCRRTQLGRVPIRGNPGGGQGPRVAQPDFRPNSRLALIPQIGRSFQQMSR
jgi:hypothetical protein